MDEFGGPRAADTRIVPVFTQSDPRSFGRGQWNDDRAGRFVLVGLVFAVVFLIVAAALWWASGANRGRSDALANEASTIAPITSPATVVATGEVGVQSTLPLSPYPLPAQGLVMSEAPATAPPTAPPATTAPAVAEVASTIAETTTTTTTTSSTSTTTSTTTTAPSTSTTPPTTVAPISPVTTTAISTTTPTTTTPTTTAPTTTTPGPVVTSPSSPDATLLDVVTDTPDLSRVRELVDMSGFGAELDAARSLTFLAPSNAAVDAWAATPEGQAVLADPDAVYDLLLRHLVPEAVDEETIFTRTSLDTVSGAQLVVRQQSRTVSGADLLVADVTAANGYLHVMSDVLT